MFDNIGGKIKTLAKVVCWIGIIACIITGIVLMATDEDLILVGILTVVVGSLLSWVGSFALYGFGQLIENSDEIVFQNKNLLNTKADKQNRTSTASEREYFGGTSNIKQTNASPDESQHKWRCASCGEMISSIPCLYCGSDKTANKLETSNPDKIVCSLCGFEQPSNRVYCWHCSTKFDNSDH